MGHFLLYKLIPALILAVFIVLMNSGTFLKHPRGTDDNVPKYFNLLHTSIQARHWPEAASYLNKLESAWRKIVPRIQFSEERDEINNFQHSLARLKGYLEAREKAQALAELKEIVETWADLGN
ncbi:MAG TPA: DUF4363 family protein [Bacillota bacterium]